MKKRRQLTLADWSSIPTTPVKQEANYDRTLGDYNRRIAAEQDATQKEVTCQFWSRPLSEIGNPKVWREADAFDPNVGLEDGRVENNSIEQSFTEFLHKSISLTGYELSDDGAKRLCWFGMAMAVRQKNVGTPEAWVKCFSRMRECKCFADGETVFHKDAKREQPRDERPTMDDLMAVDDSTRQGLREAHRIADELAFIERQPMVKAWFDSLRKFGITVTHEDAERCKQWFLRCNKSFLNPLHFDECRRWNAKAGYWVDALTSVERVNDEIEKADLSRMGFEERRILNNKKRAAQEADVARFGHAQ